MRLGRRLEPTELGLWQGCFSSPLERPACLKVLSKYLAAMWAGSGLQRGLEKQAETMRQQVLGLPYWDISLDQALAGLKCSLA